MSFDKRYLNMKEAGQHIGQSYRWMQRHYVDLIRDGVTSYRIPKESPKGRLMFDKASLDAYMQSCRISAGVSV